MKKLLVDYGHDRLQDGVKNSSLVNMIAYKHLFLAFKSTRHYQMGGLDL
jgi:hypothetical protein